MGNMLTWATSTEVNNKAFEIEKSTDGENYIKIGKVKGAVNAADATDYRFMDVSAGQGRTFYRLKQIDVDGKKSFSGVVYSEKETANNFTIVAMTPPSEDDNIFEVTINAIGEEDLDYKIFDMAGNVVYTQKQKLKKGINIISVDLSAINTDMGFAGNNDLLGDKVGYRLSLDQAGLSEPRAHQHKRPRGHHLRGAQCRSAQCERGLWPSAHRWNGGAAQGQSQGTLHHLDQRGHED